MQAEFEAAFLLGFRIVELLGRVEHKVATADEQQLFRLLTPIAKLTTAKQAVTVTSEAIEACGGAGYIEDTGLPMILRDTQVLPIWEGTTNILSLDTLRAAAGLDGFRLLLQEIKAQLATASDPMLRPCVQTAERALSHSTAWLEEHAADSQAIEAGARRLALSFGRTLELSLLTAHAQWCLDHGRGKRAALSARRFAQHGVDLIFSQELG
jgi:hypothetical protein